MFALLGCDHIIKAIKDDTSLATRTLLSSLTLLKGIVCGSVDVLDFSMLDLSGIGKTEVQLPNDTCLQLLTLKEDLAWVQVQVKGGVEADTPVVFQHVLTLTQTLVQGHIELQQQLIEEKSISQSLLSYLVPIDLLQPLRRRLYLQSYDALQESTQQALKPKPEDASSFEKEHIDKMQDVLQGLADCTQMVLTCTAAQQAEERKPEKMFEKAIYIIKERLRGYEGEI